MIYKICENIITKSNFQELYSFLKELHDCGVDTETEGFDPHSCNLLSIQFGNFDKQFFINCLKEKHLKRKLEIIFKLNVIWILHNSKFDLKFLYKSNIIVRTKIYDTFLAECVLYTGYNFKDDTKDFYVDTSLRGICYKYLKIDLDKTVRANINKNNLNTEKVILYAINDVKYLPQLKEKQLHFITEKELNAVLELENEAVKVFSLMEYNGVKINVNEWNKVSIQINSELLDIKNGLDSEVRENKFLAQHFVSKQIDIFTNNKMLINWKSNLQKKKLINLLNIPVTGVSERELMRVREKHSIIKSLLNYNKLNKLSNSFGSKFLKFVNPITSRVHYTIWQILQTGRISIEKPNVNQIPSKGKLAQLIRSCFIPEEGNVLVGGDYSGMELRIIAEFSKSKLWIDTFNNDEDLHSVLCAITFNIPIEDVKKESHYKKGVSYRDIQKTINFGLAYGMTEYKLADTMDIDTKPAKIIINNFFKVVPDVEKFLNHLGNLAKTRGYIKTNGVYKRIRNFPEWVDAKATNDFVILSEIERAGKNTPIQGTNADIIKLALIKIQHEIWDRNLPIKIVLAVYDEIRTECPIELAEKWKLKMNEIMIESAKTIIKSVPIKVDCNITNKWEK